jgi:hypothetical protein
MANFDEVVKSRISPPLAGGDFGVRLRRELSRTLSRTMKGRGINNLPGILDSSPSPQPSPIKGEGVFLTFYEIIDFKITRIFF